MDDLLPKKVRELREAAETVAREHLAANAEEVDREAAWPRRSLEALSAAGLMGLHVPQRLGGQEQGLVALIAVTEALAKACSSSAICFGMHCVASAVIAAKATPLQEERYLRPIAEGRHITSLALSERGTGAHFYLPQTRIEREEDRFYVSGTKQFVTSGGEADSYVISTTVSGAEAESGEFNCLVLDAGTPNISWLEPWNGFGMRGNASRGLQLDRAPVPLENLLGEEGDEIWYMFEIVTPYFLMAMSATYLGIAQAALDIALQHLGMREYAHSGEKLSQIPILQHRFAELWLAVEKSRYLIYNAARLSDLGDPQALVPILLSKSDVADTVVRVTNEAMSMCGGIAYRENHKLARLLRDARASHVMAPTTDMLKQWAGRALLGLPLL